MNNRPAPNGFTANDEELAVLRSTIRVVALSNGPQDARETVARLCRMLIPDVPAEVTTGLADRLYSLVDGL